MKAVTIDGKLWYYEWRVGHVTVRLWRALPEWFIGMRKARARGQRRDCAWIRVGRFYDVSVDECRRGANIGPLWFRLDTDRR